MSSFPTIDAMQAENALLRQRIAELETSERALRNIIQTTLDRLEPVIYIRDAEGTFTLVNEAHAQVLKRQRHDILGKKDSDLFPREVWEGFRVNDRIVAETRKVVAEEETLPFDDGIHTFLSLKFPIIDESGALIATGGISTDITRHSTHRSPSDPTRPVRRPATRGRYAGRPLNVSRAIRTLPFARRAYTVR